MVRCVSVVKQGGPPRDTHAPCYNRPDPEHAGVAELVDAPDSKSGGARAPCRFEPDLRYWQNLLQKAGILLTRLTRVAWGFKRSYTNGYTNPTKTKRY